MSDAPERRRVGWATRVVAGILALAVYALSSGPMTYAVLKLNGGEPTLRAPLRILVLPWWPIYRLLEHAPQPVVRVWAAYDGYFARLATKP
jgi:hypothetical protein